MLPRPVKIRTSLPTEDLLLLEGTDGLLRRCLLDAVACLPPSAPADVRACDDVIAFEGRHPVLRVVLRDGPGSDCSTGYVYSVRCTVYSVQCVGVAALLALVRRVAWLSMCAMRATVLNLIRKCGLLKCPPLVLQSYCCNHVADSTRLVPPASRLPRLPPPVALCVQAWKSSRRRSLTLSL